MARPVHEQPAETEGPVEFLSEPAQREVRKARPVHQQLADTKGPFDCRSEPAQGEVSSQLVRPRWRRLLRAAALLLSKMLVASGRAEEVWTYPNAIGGGTETDFNRLLASCLEACDLGDEQTGSVLIGTYTFLQATDLPLTARTWRVLVVTAMLASVKVLITHRAMAAKIDARLKDDVAHWWPKANADMCVKVFTSRQKFKQMKLNPSCLARSYFLPREKSLSMGSEDQSAASAVYDWSRISGNSLIMSEDSIGNSLILSEDSIAGESNEDEMGHLCRISL